KALGEGGRDRRKLERAGKNESGNQDKERGHAAALTAHVTAPPECRRPQLAGGDNGHYPSSWYSKAKKPVRPPTQTGNHAAAMGCINSALLKSSVTFDKTLSRKPAPTPLKTIFCTPPIRKKRNDTEAASITIAASKNGCARSF